MIYKSDVGQKVVLERYKEILSFWPVENRQYHVDTRYGETFVIESGSRTKPPLLLLHGSVSNSFCWFGDVERLSENYNVYAIDIIGEAGFSSPERPAYEKGHYAEWLKDVVSELALKSVSLVGLSLGGWMALDFTTRYPEFADNLILICPGGLSREKTGFLLKFIFYSFAGEWGKRKIWTLLNGGKKLELTSDGMRAAMDFTALISKHFKPRMAKLPLYGKDKLSRIDIPAMLIYGEKDCIHNVPESVDVFERWVPKARIEVLPDTGHIVVNQTGRMLDFLAG
ncbi:MAG: alpha/beta hydrolase [Desulfobacterales bacterium]|nr:alpha/beta hydrolase [Desulfobacterales bacterium]